jgi:hypothetical protein
MLHKGEQAKFPQNSKLQKRFNLELITMIITKNSPFNFAGQEGFRHFMSWVAPGYTLKGRHCMSKELTPLLHQNVKTDMDKILAQELPHCENVAFTADECREEPTICTYC